MAYHTHIYDDNKIHMDGLLRFKRMNFARLSLWGM